jgi:hypothetical protein
MKKYTFVGQKGKNRLRAQHQYGRVKYSSIKNFRWSKKKYTFKGQKGENKPSVPKKKNWGPKLV